MDEHVMKFAELPAQLLIHFPIFGVSTSYRLQTSNLAWNLLAFVLNTKKADIPPLSSPSIEGGLPHTKNRTQKSPNQEINGTRKSTGLLARFPGPPRRLRSSSLENPRSQTSH